MGSVKSIAEFLRVLQASGLLSAEQWDVAERHAVESPSPEALVDCLVAFEWLTPWQAEHLLSGRSGFRLDDYDLLGLLGRGRMGMVFKARKRTTGRVVAIKLMAPEHLQNSRSVTRFLREIRLAANTSHPNVVAALDAGCLNDGRYYLVTEYVPGRNLEQWLKQESPLPVNWVCHCVWEAARGLQHIYEQGLLHRDIKPSNIVAIADSVQAVPHVKLLDLGLGRFIEQQVDDGSLTRDGFSLGTMEYSAPEQIENVKSIDIRADIYGLGTALFQLLTGRLPFAASTQVERLTAKMMQNPPSMSRFRTGIPDGLVRIVHCMLERDRNQRPAIPSDVVTLLEPFTMPLEVRRPASERSEG